MACVDLWDASHRLGAGGTQPTNPVSSSVNRRARLDLKRNWATHPVLFLARATMQ